MKTQFSINGTQLTRNRYAQSKEQYINSYAYLQLSASKSRRGNVSSGFTLSIPASKSLILIREDLTPETNLKKLILHEIINKLQYLKGERKWLKKPELLAFQEQINILKWVYLNWDTPQINKPVIKEFPNVSSQWLEYVKEHYPVLVRLEEDS